MFCSILKNIDVHYFCNFFAFLETFTLPFTVNYTVDGKVRVILTGWHSALLQVMELHAGRMNPMISDNQVGIIVIWTAKKYFDDYQNFSTISTLQHIEDLNIKISLLRYRGKKFFSPVRHIRRAQKV
jgi:hypothetical protein